MSWQATPNSAGDWEDNVIMRDNVDDDGGDDDADDDDDVDDDEDDEDGDDGGGGGGDGDGDGGGEDGDDDHDDDVDDDDGDVDGDGDGDDDDDDDGDEDGDDENDNAEDEVEDEKVDDDDVEKGEDDDVEEEGRSKTGTILREPAQSKCTWKLCKSLFIQNFMGKMPRPRLNPERNTLDANLCSRNACQNFTKTTLCGNSQEKCRSPAGSHNRDPHLCELAQPKWTSTFHKSHQQSTFTEISRKNAVAQSEPRTRTHILREPARSKRMPKFHQNNLTRKFAGKMPQARVGTVIKLWHSLLPQEPLSVWTHCLRNHRLMS